MGQMMAQWDLEKSALADVTLNPPIEATVFAKDVFSVKVVIKRMIGINTMDLSYPTSMALQTCEEGSSLLADMTVIADAIEIIGDLVWQVDIPIPGGGSVGQTVAFNATMQRPRLSFNMAWPVRPITPEQCFLGLCFYPLGNLRTGGTLTYSHIDLGIAVIPSLQIPDTLGGILSDFLFLPEQLLFDLLASLVVDAGWAIADKIAQFRSWFDNVALQPALQKVFDIADSGLNSLLQNATLPIPNPYQLYTLRNGVPVPTLSFPINVFGGCGTPLNKTVTLRGKPQLLYSKKKMQISVAALVVTIVYALMFTFAILRNLATQLLHV